MDTLSKTKRSLLMSKVKQRDTSPELAIRKILHSMGLRFRLHRKDLPGTPDIVLPKHSLIIFVHGCFWHRHVNCKKASTPKDNFPFWEAKFSRNIERDATVKSLLEAKGWRVEVIWECELKQISILTTRLHSMFHQNVIS